MLIATGALVAISAVGPARAADAPTPGPDDRLGIQLLEAPADRRDDPWARTYIVDHVHPGSDLGENHVIWAQRIILVKDEELAAVGIWTRVGHCDDTTSLAGVIDRRILHDVVREGFPPRAFTARARCAGI